MLSKVTSVLIVDRDNNFTVALTRILEKCNCIVSVENSAEGAIDTLLNSHFDVVLSDVKLNGELGGDDLLEIVQNKFPATNVVLLSNDMGVDRKNALIQKGAIDCLQKPLQKDTCSGLLAQIRMVSSNNKVA